jgi:hypothetical protein
MIQYVLAADSGDDISLLIQLLDAETLARLIGLGVPVLVALITKQHAPSWVKGVANFLLTAVGASIAYVVGVDGGFDFQAWTVAFFNALTASAASYLVLWKNTLAPALAGATRDFGLGTNQPLVPAYKTADGSRDATGYPSTAGRLVREDDPPR